MFGSANYLNDIKQGAVGDCYFLAAISAVGENQTRLNKTFVNPIINWAGVYVFNVFIRGIPYLVYVDDAVPAGTFGKSPVFAKIGSDNSLWGPLLEKAWAKVNGNYENIEAGGVYTAVTFLTNSQGTQFPVDNKTLNATAMWNKIKEADDLGYVMSFGTPSVDGGDSVVCNLNLPCSHAYTIISTKVITKADLTKIYLY